MKKNETAKFQLQDIPVIIGLLVVSGIYGTYALKIQSDVRTTMTTNSLEYNASTDAMTGVSKISGQLPNIGLVAGAVIIIGMLSYLVFRR